MTTEDSIEYVEVITQYNILLCRLCPAGVRPGEGIERHLRDEHQVKGRILREIIYQYSDAALNDPVTGTLPEDGSPAIPQLPVLGGFSCDDCRFFTKARDNVVRHRKSAGHDGPGGWTQVDMQAWSKGRYARYWRVEVQGSPGTATAEKKSAIEEAIEGVEKELKAEQAERLRKGDCEEDIDRDSSWVKRAQWVRHFRSRDLIDIHDAAQWVRAKKASVGRVKQEEQDEEAAREQAALTRLGESFDREVARCCHRLECVPTESLQWLQSISSTAPSGQPFRVKGQESSMTKYRSVGHRYLGFCWRAFQMGREEASTRLAIEFTAEQWGLLADIESELGLGSGLIQTPGSGLTQEGPGSSDSDGYSADDDSVSTGAHQESIARLDQAVFRLIMASVKQQVGGKVYVSPLLSFCAALGIRRQPLGFAEPHLYTGLLAAILWWSRLFFLEAFFAGEPADIEMVSPEMALRFREEHATWLCAGTHTPVSSIIGWMAYAKGIRRSTAGRASVRWSEDRETLYQHGEAIVVADFKRTAQELVVKGEAILNQLLSSRWSHVSGEIDMERIADSMIRVGAGQSFATNEKNSWLQPGAGKVMRLLGSQIWDGVRSRWKAGAVKQWLRRLRRFREQLLVATHVWAGQPGRGPELTTMRHCDSWQLLRNVFVVGGAVLIVTDRDKMKAIRDNGHKVARLLPDRVGRMMVAYITWLLPAEQALRRVAGFPDPQEAYIEFL